MWDEMAAPRRRLPKANWMISLTDLMSLILAFFVLLFSTKSLNTQKWQDISDSLRTSFVATQPDDILPMALDEAAHTALSTSDGLEYLQALFVRRLGSDAVWGQVAKGTPTTAQPGAPGLPGRLGYPLPGEAMTDAAAVTRLAGVVRNWDNELVVMLRLKSDTADAALPLSLLAQAFQWLQKGGVPLTRAELAPATAERPVGLWLEIVGKAN
jgi:hypothetical protein